LLICCSRFNRNINGFFCKGKWASAHFFISGIKNKEGGSAAMAGLPEGVLEQIKGMAETLTKESGLELVDLEFRREGRGWVLRMLIDKSGGVTLDDCAAVSRELSDQIDVEDLIPSRYTLEVSSPGLDRPLKREEDFLKQLGKTIQLSTSAPLDGQSFFRGKMMDYQKGGLLLLADKKKIWEIPVSLIAKARLVFEG
jgi:ribosome maturation factor RimP